MRLHSKQAEKNVEKKIQDILKVSGITREEYNEALGIANKMKSSGKTGILVATTLFVVGPSERIAIARPSVQIPRVPYVVVAQVQPR